MTDFLKKNYPILIIMILAFATRFAFLGYPAEVVFDEVHFGKFVNAYFTNEYYFDIHPPLGKMFIAGFAKISGVSPDFDFSQIGKKFNNGDFLMLRFLPALFGALIPLLIYLILKQTGLSSKTAFFGSFLAIFDNALLVQSKFILLDSMLMAFGFSSLYFFFKYRKEQKNGKSLLFLMAGAALAVFSFGIKWTGLSFAGIIILIFLIDLIRKKIGFKTFVSRLFIFTLAGFVIYYFIFWIHFQILYKSGPGSAYMSQNFQQTLAGNNSGKTASPPTNFAINNQENLNEPSGKKLVGGKPLPYWQKFVELNQKMYYYNSTIKATHQDSSKWYQWPISIKPVWYWSKNETGKSANIYLFGNLIAWWTVLAGIIFSFFAITSKKTRQKLPPVFYLFLLGYFSNLLPYIFIGRVAFLYHYLPALIFGILALSVLYEKILSPFIASRISAKSEKIFYSGYLGLCLIFFIIFSPLSYGFAVSSNQLNDFYQSFIQFLS